MHVTCNHKIIKKKSLACKVDKVARTPIRSAVLVRALNNIIHTVELLDVESLEKIVSASTNLDVLLSLFEESVALESKIPTKEDPLRSIRLKGIQGKEKEGTGRKKHPAFSLFDRLLY
ncbi:MAG: hypothetical protein NT166_13065 [Candidatus Aminicenantes bacterium]|nr:hypothetical protein [Candidatus Aminicenantes bacterium]